MDIGPPARLGFRADFFHFKGGLKKTRLQVSKQQSSSVYFAELEMKSEQVVYLALVANFKGSKLYIKLLKEI